MPPAWLGRVKCKRGVSGEALPDCPVVPSHIRFIEGVGWEVTRHKCQNCGQELQKAFNIRKQKAG